MREFKEPTLVSAPRRGNLTDDVKRNATETPDHIAIRRRVGTEWEDLTAADFYSEIVAVAKGLIALGIEPGQRIGLMSRTRYEWTLADYAIWFVGAVTVPIYETSSSEQVEWILGNSGSVAVFLETEIHEAKFDEVSKRLPDTQRAWVFEKGAIDALVEAGKGVKDADVEKRRKLAKPSDVATIIYTSGTTGRPKGCVLTHGNFMFDVTNVVQSMPEVFLEENSSTLLFLPLAHVFGRLIQIGCINSRTTLGHSADVKDLLNDLGAFKPTFLLSVPRVFEKVFNSAQQKATAEGKGRIFDLAASTAIEYSEALDRGGASIVLKVKHTAFDKLVYSKLRAVMGGRVRWAVSGGAPLGARLGHFYRGIGITILEGYGLTETTGASTVNRPSGFKIGSVGRPLNGTAVRIAEDGEILLYGPQVFKGYWDNDEATAEAIESNGWFHTGDIGEIDDQGFVKITGRKKELIVTAGGKNVAPAVLEDRLRANWLVSQCMVVGDAQPYIAALVTIDPESLPQWLTMKGKPASASVAELTDDPDLRTEIQSAVDEANKAVSAAEAIKKFKILPVDWTEDGGQLTPSMKLKRNVVMSEFANEVDSLYSK